MSEFWSSLSTAINERVRNLLLGGFALAWVPFNYCPLAVLFLGDTPGKANSFVKALEAQSVYQLFGGPLSVSLWMAFLMPALDLLFAFTRERLLAAAKRLKLNVHESATFTAHVHRNLHEVKRLTEMYDRRNKEIADLKTELEGANATVEKARDRDREVASREAGANEVQESLKRQVSERQDRVLRLERDISNFIVASETLIREQNTAVDRDIHLLALGKFQDFVVRLRSGK